MANVAATFTANISGYTKAMKDMQSSTGRTTSGIKANLSSSGSGILKLGALFGVAAKVGSSAMSAIGNGIRGMYTELNESSAAWQTFEGNMKFLGKTPGQIKTVEKSLQKYAQQTVYSASDMASSYSQFAAVGVKGVGGLVKGMGGLAAATDNPQQAMKTLMQQSVQAAAKPTIQWQDFRLMLEQTPAGMAAVAKQMGMSVGDLIKKIQDGKVKTTDFFDTVSKAGNGKAFQRMATSYKTVGQAMDGLKETLANKLQPAWKKLSGVAIKAINSLIDWISKIDFNTLADKAIAFATVAANAIKKVIAVVKQVFDFVNQNKDWLLPLVAGITTFVVTFKSIMTVISIINSVKSAFSALSAVFMANPIVLVVAAIAALVAGLVVFFTKTKTGQKIWAGFVKWLKGSWEGLKTTATSVWNAITDAVSGAVEGVQNAWNGIADFFTGLWNGIKTTAENLWTGIVDGAKSAWNGLTSFLSGLWTGIVNIATSIWGGISSFFTGLWNGIVSVAMAVWNTFGPALTTIWQGIVNVAKGVWNMLKAVIMGPILIVIDLLTGNWKQLSSDLQLIWNSIVEAAGQIWNGLVTYFSGIWDFIKTYAMTVWNALVSALEGIWNGVVSAASSIWNALTSFFSGLWNGIVSTAKSLWNGVVSFLKNLWNGTVNTAKNIWNALPGFFSGLWNRVTSFFSSAWNRIKSIVINAAHNIVNGARNVWNGFTRIVSNVVNGIRNGFNALRHFSLAGAGRAIMNSLFSGLRSAWGRVKSFVGGIASWIRKHKGPISYDAKLLIPAGNAIMGGLNQGLQKSFSDVQQTVSGMASDISANMSANINGLSMAGTQFSSGDVTQSIDASERITPNIYVQNNVDKNGINSMVKEADANDAAVSSYFRPIGG